MTLSPKIKRILYAILFVLAVAALAYLLYTVFFRDSEREKQLIEDNISNVNRGQLPTVNEPSDNTNVPPANENETPTLPDIDTVASGGDTLVSSLTPDTKTEAPAASRDGSMRYYDPEEGKFYRVDEAGNISQIGSAQFPNVETVTWAPTTDQAILEFPDGNNIFYDFNTNEQETLPKEYKEFNFSPGAETIAFKYMHPDEERRVLAISNPNGTEAQTLESLGANEDHVKVEWSPTGKVAALYSEFIDLNRQQVGFIGLNQENFKGIVVHGSGLKTKYSPDGTRLLYSTYSSATDNQHTLSIVDSDGQNIGNNNRTFELRTSADKCAFSADGASVYCGVPSENEYGSGIAPDILNDVPDDIYTIDLNTGISSKVATPVNENGTPSFRVENMFVTEDGGQLIFKDANSGELITIDLR